MNIEESNIIIHEWAGKASHIPSELLKYDKSWNWIMPIVGKIREKSQANAIYINQWMNIAAALYRVDLPLVYKFTLEFIIYDNNLKIAKQ